jgi:hypothetical protein
MRMKAIVNSQATVNTLKKKKKMMMVRITKTISQVVDFKAVKPLDQIIQKKLLQVSIEVQVQLYHIQVPTKKLTIDIF